MYIRGKPTTQLHKNPINMIMFDQNSIYSLSWRTSFLLAIAFRMSESITNYNFVFVL